jgi:transcriptional regulator with XRE-family HTH domain
MEFGNRLYELRKKKGLSQEELGNKINVSRQTISKYELSEAIPDMEKLVLLSDYFHVSLDELVLGNEVREPSVERPPSVIRKKVEALCTETNKKRARKFLKIAGIVFLIVLAIDLISMLIYFLINGFPG